MTVYDPIRDGVDRSARHVRYAVVRPPERLSDLVHCYWELRTEAPLGEDFGLHAIPDACVNILFNLAEPEIAGITALRTTHEVLNLGRAFHYAGIQLLPGVWRGNRAEIAFQYVGTRYEGALPLIAAGRRLAELGFAAGQDVMSDLVVRFASAGLVARNPVTGRILARLDEIRSVAGMAQAAGLSPRQLQRRLKRTTGFSPHDLLKVLRLQQSFRQHYLDLYADQSHYIHSFRRVTGYTPGQFAEKFDV